MDRTVYEFISKQNQDPIIEWRTCTVSGKEFPVFQSDKEFYEKVSPSFGGKKYMIPFPSLCPEERHRRRLLFRNERKLYKRKCDVSGKDIISIYSPDKPYQVCDHELWRSDQFDASSYGREFDFSKSFTEQFHELMMAVPMPSLHVIANEQSIVNQCGYSKKCYFSFNTDFSEECLYCVNTIHSKNCIDMLHAEHCEQCAYSFDIKKSYKVFYSSNIQDSNNIYYSQDLQGCSYCFGCKNLQHKQYCYFNKQYDKGEYVEKMKEINFGDQTTHGKIQAMVEEYIATFPKQTMRVLQSEASCGNHIHNGQQAQLCFDSFDVENISYCFIVSYIKTSMDFTIGGYDCDLCLDVASSGDHNYHCLYCMNIRGNSEELYYCHIAKDTKHCFACVGVHGKEYCIFNKQYSKEEYEALVPKIIEHMQKTGEWGEFFHPSLSPFAYNETIAQEYFPIDYNLATQRSYIWKTEHTDISIPQNMTPLVNDDIPREITEVTDDICSKAIICGVSAKPFRITQQELVFYRQHHIPLPLYHPDVRHQQRLDQRRENILYLRVCDKCGVEMLSVYSTMKSDEENEVGGKKQKVYCESCYQKEVYG